MKSLVIITPRFPYPVHGGDLLRIYRIADYLSRFFKITLISVCQTRQELDAQLPQDAPFANVFRFYLPKYKSYLNVLLAFFQRKSFQLAYYHSNSLARFIEMNSTGHDYLLCHLLRMAPYGINFSGRKVLELTDHLPLTYRRSNAVKSRGSFIKSILYKCEESRIGFDQYIHAKAYDAVTFVSNLDATFFCKESSFNKSYVYSFPNGVSSNLCHRELDSEPAHVAFVGNMNSLQNSDAVIFFMEEIYPHVIRICPTIKFNFIGLAPHHLKFKFGRFKNVFFTGAVPSIADSLSNCAIGICPVRIGAGVQNKILDYMSSGLATVTTSVGAEGIDCSNHINSFIVDDPELFAAQIVQLAQSRKLVEKIGQAARSTIEKSYSWEKKLSGFEKVFE